MLITSIRAAATAVALLVLIAAGGCGGHSSPDGRDAPHAMKTIDHQPPGPTALLNARYDLAEPIGSIRVSDGVWADPASGRTVTLVRESTLTGDLYSDGGHEAVVILRVRQGDAESLQVAVLDVLDGRPHTVAATAIDGPARLIDATLDGPRVVLRVAGGPDAAAAARRVVLRLTGQRLVVEAEGAQ